MSNRQIIVIRIIIIIVFLIIIIIRRPKENAQIVNCKCKECTPTPEPMRKVYIYFKKFDQIRMKPGTQR